MQTHDSNVRVSVRKFETDKAPTRPLSPPAAFWRRVDWSTVFPITALLLQLTGGLWLLVLTAAVSVHALH